MIVLADIFQNGMTLQREMPITFSLLIATGWLDKNCSLLCNSRHDSIFDPFLHN